MTSGDLNPGYFINPPALTYLLAAWFSVIHLGGVEQWFADDPGAVFLAGRWISVAFGVGAVAATYAAGKALFDRRAGLVAAAIMAVAFLPVFYSRLALNDGPGVLPCALALWASAIVLKTGSTKGAARRGRERRARRVAEVLRRRDRRRGGRGRAAVAAELQGGVQGPRARRADLDRGRDRHQPVPVRGLGARSRTTSTASASSPPATRCSASRSATAGWYYVSPARVGARDPARACWRSRAGSRCWSKAVAARRSCSARSSSSTGSTWAARAGSTRAGCCRCTPRWRSSPPTPSR